MLTKCPKIFVVLFLFLFSKSIVYAQQTYPFFDHWGLGANIGMNYFYGDVNDNKGRIWSNTPLSGFYYTDKNLMINVSLTKDISRFWGIRGHLAYGKLSGSNEKTSMYFKGSVYSMDMDVTFHFLDYILKRPESSKFKFYAFAGMGLFSFDAIRRDITTDVFQNAMGFDQNGNHTNFTTESLLKLGLGIGYQLNKKWLFNFETALNYTNSDDLDAFRSTSSKREGFGYMSLGVVYKFDLNVHFESRSSNSLWEKSKGDNNRSYNSGLNNKKKRKLHNKWKK